MENYMYNISCLFVCLFVCLSLQEADQWGKQEIGIDGFALLYSSLIFQREVHIAIIN